MCGVSLELGQQSPKGVNILQKVNMNRNCPPHTFTSCLDIIFPSYSVCPAYALLLISDWPLIPQ